MFTYTERSGAALERSKMPSDARVLLDHMSAQQFLHPHRTVKRALDVAVMALDYCPASSERAMGWLEIDPAGLIGRVRRTELAQLTRTIHRFSSQIRLVMDRPVVSTCVET